MFRVSGMALLQKAKATMNFDDLFPSEPLTPPFSEEFLRNFRELESPTFPEKPVSGPKRRRYRSPFDETLVRAERGIRPPMTLDSTWSKYQLRRQRRV